MYIDQIESELQNFIDKNSDEIFNVMQAFGGNPTPSDMVIAFAAHGRNFSDVLTKNIEEFSSLDGEPKKRDVIGDWLQRASDLILTGKAVRETIQGKKDENQGDPTVELKTESDNGKIFGLPKALLGLIILVLILISFYVGLTYLKQK